MKDDDKTREQLIEEIKALRERAALIKPFKTSHDRIREAALELEAKFNTLFDRVLDIVIIVDSGNGKIIDVNRAAARIWGYEKKELVGKKFDIIFNSISVPTNDEFIERVNLYGSVSETQDFLCADGAFISMDFLAAKVAWGKRDAIMIFFRDATERMQGEEERERLIEENRALALRDDLTGLYNQRGFTIFGQMHLKLAQRTKQDMLLLCVGLNGLEQVTTAYGHTESSQALLATANVLKKTFRGSDVLARMNVGEFAVFAVNADPNAADSIIERLNEAVEVYNSKGISHKKISCNVGIAHYDHEHPCSITELMARADRILLEQKRRKKDDELKKSG